MRNWKESLRRYSVMIKDINWPRPTRIIIYKDGNIVADFHTSDIKGGLDASEIKSEVNRNQFDGQITIRLEV